MEALSVGGTAVRWEEPGGEHSQAQGKKRQVREEMTALSLGRRRGVWSWIWHAFGATGTKHDHSLGLEPRGIGGFP